MKSIRHIFPLLLLPLLLLACSEDDDPVTITTNMGQASLHYSADGTWIDVATNKSFSLQYLQFNHEGEIGTWGLSWKGFTPARYADLDYSTVTNWAEHQFQIPSRGGMSGVGTPYIVALWDTQENETTPASVRSCRVTYRENPSAPEQLFRPLEVYLQLTQYCLQTLLEGGEKARPFTSGDYLKVIAHGVREDGSESSTEFYLAGSAEAGDELSLCTSWTRMNLSMLGYVKELYFTMQSSDTGEWGMNTPAYFALDRLTVTAVLPD